jgi:hypothetical protein
MITAVSGVNAPTAIAGTTAGVTGVTGVALVKAAGRVIIARAKACDMAGS